MAKVTVGIVVDPEFGNRLADLARRGPVWIASPPRNRIAAEAWWRAHPRPGEFEGVTTFIVAEGESPERWCAGVLPTVDMHFGAYEENAPMYAAVEVFGASATPELRDLLATTGYTQVTERAGGFRATRDEAAA
jgi:hypothetical protein